MYYEQNTYMSWDGVYAKDRLYPTFEVGDEVYTTKLYRALTIDKPYIVINCYTPPGYVSDCNIKVIEVMTDGLYISRYATNHFKKTDAQIRDDKLKAVLDGKIEI